MTIDSQLYKWRRTALWIVVVLLPLVLVHPAAAYVPDQRWTTTANGGTGSIGTPVTLTWSIVPDGTSIPGRSPSNLKAYLDEEIGVGDWLPLFQAAFDRWSALGGITFVYESNDDGVSLNSSGGAQGVRGDIRISGTLIDGANNTLAYASLPNDGDIVFDTGETGFFSNSTNNFRAFRNTIMHESAHAFGLLHVQSDTNNFLMEPAINTSFDGPQLDDIRGIQGFYGDIYEKSNNGDGNNSFSTATNLGPISIGGSLFIGSDAAIGQRVEPIETNFVSIDTNTDTDFFSFNLISGAKLNFTLTPLGGTFNQGAESQPQTLFDANARNDLTLAVLAANGTTVLGTSNLGGPGTIESITGLSLADTGQYFVRVTGATPDAMQLYQLQVAAVSALGIPGDFNNDRIVNAADYATWRNLRNQTGPNLTADADGNGVVNDLDYNIWRANFGRSAGSGVVLASGVVPESASILYWLTALVFAVLSRRQNFRS